MAFTVKDYHDLVRLLAEHPEWQMELRRLLIAEDLQALPGLRESWPRPNSAVRNV